MSPPVGAASRSLGIAKVGYYFRFSKFLGQNILVTPQWLRCLRCYLLECRRVGSGLCRNMFYNIFSPCGGRFGVRRCRVRFHLWRVWSVASCGCRSSCVLSCPRRVVRSPVGRELLPLVGASCLRRLPPGRNVSAFRSVGGSSFRPVPTLSNKPRRAGFSLNPPRLNFANFQTNHFKPDFRVVFLRVAQSLTRRHKTQQRRN